MGYHRQWFLAVCRASASRRQASGGPRRRAETGRHRRVGFPQLDRPSRWQPAVTISLEFDRGSDSPQGLILFDGVCVLCSRGCHFVSKVAVGLIVTAVLLLTGRERLHTMARQLELPEVVTAGMFLILTGIILPLLAGTRGHKPAMP